MISTHSDLSKCVCVIISVQGVNKGERAREQDRKRDRQTDKVRETENKTDGKTERQKQKQIHTDKTVYRMHRKQKSDQIHMLLVLL